MPNWKKVIVSGSNAILSAVTASNGFFGTASWATSASQAVTASYALNGGGSGASPAGNQYSVQVNSGSGQFYGNSRFTYQAGSTDKLSFTPSGSDYNSTSYDQNNNDSFTLRNARDNLWGTNHNISLFPRAALLRKNTNDAILSLNVGSTANNKLTITGFKCDYTVSYGNLSNYPTSPNPEPSDTRIGTLLAAWSWDLTTSNISDNHIISDMNGVLKDGVFTLSWASNILTLSYDSGANISEDCVFSGLFTIFSNK